MNETFIESDSTLRNCVIKSHPSSDLQYLKSTIEIIDSNYDDICNRILYRDNKNIRIPENHTKIEDITLVDITYHPLTYTGYMSAVMITFNFGSYYISTPIFVRKNKTIEFCIGKRIYKLDDITKINMLFKKDIERGWVVK